MFNEQSNLDKMNFTAIDFETATGYRNSACAVGIITVEEGQIVDEFYTLIQPPNNSYWYQNIQVHGITPDQTIDSPLFEEVFHEISKRLMHQTIVAHNEGFDRGVLAKTMELYGLSDNRISLSEKWECTMKIFRQKGLKKYNLKACCDAFNIELNHHNALSDALGCAKLYLLKDSF